jgi:hypothetical protein
VSLQESELMRQHRAAVERRMRFFPPKPVSYTPPTAQEKLAAHKVKPPEKALAPEPVKMVKPSRRSEPTPDPMVVVRDWLNVRSKGSSADPERRLLPIPKYPPIKMILAHVSQLYGVTVPDLLSARRTVGVVRPRQIAMYLAKTTSPRSLPDIGRNMGGRDHTTVLHAVRKIESLCETDDDVAAQVFFLRTKVMDEMEAAERPPVMLEAAE